MMTETNCDFIVMLIIASAATTGAVVLIVSAGMTDWMEDS